MSFKKSPHYQQQGSADGGSLPSADNSRILRQSLFNRAKKSSGRSTTPLGADSLFAEEAVYIVKPNNTYNYEEIKIIHSKKYGFTFTRRNGLYQRWFK